MNLNIFRASIEKKYGQRIVNSWDDCWTGNLMLELADHSLVAVRSQRYERKDRKGRVIAVDTDYVEVARQQELTVDARGLKQGVGCDLYLDGWFIDHYTVHGFTSDKVILLVDGGNTLINLTDSLASFKVIRNLEG